METVVTTLWVSFALLVAWLAAGLVLVLARAIQGAGLAGWGYVQWRIWGKTCGYEIRRYGYGPCDLPPHHLSPRHEFKGPRDDFRTWFNGDSGCAVASRVP